MAIHVCFVVTVLNGRVPEGACVAAVLVRDPMGALVIPMTRKVRDRGCIASNLRN